MTAPTAPPPPAGITVFQRGWLSSNNVLLDDGETRAVLVDSSHTVHAAQTVALVRHALAGRRLHLLLNTHLHSDHCGGNTAVQKAFGCRLLTPAGSHRAASEWDEAALSYRATGQLCERFTPDDALQPGSELPVGARRWQVLAAPGHDPHSVILFSPADRVLISADALWENGFGLIFPELEGVQAFEDQAAVLDFIESLRPQWVIPGHGAPFVDAAGALQRARQRLAGFRADPARHARHALRVLVKYHLMEVQALDWDDYATWFQAMPLACTVWERLGRPDGSMHRHALHVAQDLVASGALRSEGGRLLDHA